MHTKLAQLKANKSSLLQNYPHTVNPDTYMPQRPLCLTHMHDINHHFNCGQEHKTIPLVGKKSFWKQQS